MAKLLLWKFQLTWIERLIPF